jgi:hypothetical protein
MTCRIPVDSESAPALTSDVSLSAGGSGSTSHIAMGIGSNVTKANLKPGSNIDLVENFLIIGKRIRDKEVIGE